MAFQYKDIVKKNWADLKRQLPIDDILVSDKLVRQFGPEEIHRIRLCSTLQERSRNFLLGLLRKPQETFDIFMSILLELSPALHSQLETAMAHRNQHMADHQQQQQQYHEDRIGNDKTGVFEVLTHRGQQIQSMDANIKEWLAGELNGSRADRSKVVALGQALEVDGSTMSMCMRAGNPTGLLLDEYSSNNDQATVDNLISALNSCGLNDVSNHLVSRMNH